MSGSWHKSILAREGNIQFLSRALQAESLESQKSKEKMVEKVNSEQGHDSKPCPRTYRTEIIIKHAAIKGLNLHEIVICGKLH